jgi:hypothetical protein
LRYIILLFFIINFLGCQGADRQFSSVETYRDDEALNQSPTLLVDYTWEAPIEIWGHSSLSSAAISGLLQAISTWNEAVGYRVLVYKGVRDDKRGATLYESLNDNLTIVYGESDWVSTTEKPLETLGTTVWEVDDLGEFHIVKGDIILNEEHYLFQNSEEEASADKAGGVVDAETVLLHELGHLLGLRHKFATEDEASVMAPYTAIGFGDYNRTLSEADISSIRDLYVQDKAP